MDPHPGPIEAKRSFRINTDTHFNRTEPVN